MSAVQQSAAVQAIKKTTQKLRKRKQIIAVGKSTEFHSSKKSNLQFLTQRKIAPKRSELEIIDHQQVASDGTKVSVTSKGCNTSFTKVVNRPLRIDSSDSLLQHFKGKEGLRGSTPIKSPTN